MKRNKSTKDLIEGYKKRRKEALEMVKEWDTASPELDQ